MFAVQVRGARSLWATVEIPQLQHVSPRARSLTYPLCSTTGWMSKCRKLRWSRSCSTFDMVVDIPVMQLSTRFGRPVIMQRRQFSYLRCLSSCSSPELVDIQCAAENGTRLGDCSGEGAF